MTTRSRICSLVGVGLVRMSVVLPAVLAREGEWTARVLKKLAPDAEIEEEEVQLVGKIVGPEPLG